MERSDVYKAIDGERDYQQRKWGGPGEDHQVGQWLIYMDQHLEKAKQALTGTLDPQAALDAIRKLTALGVACLEQHGCPERQA